jgi:thiol-disulfide isomerase/thioredoxin
MLPVAGATTRRFALGVRHMPIRSTRGLAALALVLALAVAACGSSTVGNGASTASPGGPAETPGPAATADPVPTPGGTPDAGADTPAPGLAAAAALNRIAWATEALVDVRTGETFQIADLAGKVVFLESMAIWCTNCRLQQEQAMEAMQQVDREQVVWVVLDVDLSERAEDLARYADRNGFDFIYAVATENMARELAQEFGPVVLSPPNVPIVVVDTAGGTEFHTGPKPVDRILELVVTAGG